MPGRDPNQKALATAAERLRWLAASTAIPGAMRNPRGRTAKQVRRRVALYVCERAEVAPREGDAQKALRRTYVASSLMSGRNPKLVGAEVGHASIRMVTEVYDAFVDPSCWPNESERRKLAKVYGWELTDHDGRVISTPDEATSERPERPLQLL